MDIQSKHSKQAQFDLASITAIGFFVLYIVAGLYGAVG